MEKIGCRWTIHIFFFSPHILSWKICIWASTRIRLMQQKSIFFKICLWDHFQVQSSADKWTGWQLNDLVGVVGANAWILLFIVDFFSSTVCLPFTGMHSQLLPDCFGFDSVLMWFCGWMESAVRVIYDSVRCEGILILNMSTTSVNRVIIQSDHMHFD